MPRRGRQAQPETMTEEQRQFAAERHNLIYAFLHEKGWAPSEYYDIAALGYLRAVIRYLPQPHLQRYAFSTIAWWAMTQSISTYHRAEVRRLDSERKYRCTSHSPPLDPYEELEANLLLHDLAAMTSEKQYNLAAMRLQGYDWLTCFDRDQWSAPPFVGAFLFFCFLLRYLHFGGPVGWCGHLQTF